MKRPLSISDLMAIGGAFIVFVFSFIGFTSIDFGGRSAKANAWDTDTFAFASTVPAILALVLLVWVGLELFGVKLPERVLTFDSPQLKATWAIAAAGILLSWATVDNRSATFWLQLLAGFVMAAGTILALLGQLTDPVIKISTPGASDAGQPGAPQNFGQPGFQQGGGQPGNAQPGGQPGFAPSAQPGPPGAQPPPPQAPQAPQTPQAPQPPSTPPPPPAYPSAPSDDRTPPRGQERPPTN